MDLGGIETELSSSNRQLSSLNQSIRDGTHSIENTASQLGNIGNQWAATNQQIARTTEQVNNNWHRTNEQIDRLNDSIDQMDETITRESNNIRDVVQSESDEWQQLIDNRSDRAIRVAEKMSDPKHMFKLSASAAAGAVIGASVANLAISGIKSAVGFLVKWISGDLRKMKDEELIKEFNAAMTVYDQSSKLAGELEKRIDNILASMELHQRFRLENSEILENIQRYIINTNGLKDKKRKIEEACAGLE